MKSLTLKLTLMGAFIIAIAGSATGCSWSIGSGKHPEHTTVQPTRGQELIDLKKARDQGAINEKEYEAAKERIVHE